MTRAELIAFLRRHRLAVVASSSTAGGPQAAVVGVAVTDELELVFDTTGDTRKAQNLRRDGRAALVIGWEDEQTVQLEGLADEPQGDTLARLQRCYFEAFPDGPSRLSWPGLTYFRIRPTWVRYSDFRPASQRIVELSGPALRRA
ncbi:MAG TPA: pyridoxamine 5'-phosphate oxidase family protein [Polyangia bacterium]|jgi:pyridoxine/pyridoxamine 5'-phosphate oxidase